MKKPLFDKQQKKLSERFAQGKWLSKQDNVEQFLLWNTFYRRNMHLFAKDYIGIKLHWYQSIALYLMGICVVIYIIACRAAAKSFIIAIFSVCKAILYPGSEIVLTSGTKGQANLIISKKIMGDLLAKNPNSLLHREIKRVTDNQQKTTVEFHNGSSITVVVCSKNGRGNRSTVNVGEEAREIVKANMDTIISPFKYIRQVPYLKLPEYENIVELREEPMEIMISSSVEDSHWLYKEATTARNGMFKGNGSYFIAFDYSIVLKHGIKSRKDLIREKKKIDPITWKIEYENAVLRENTNALFTYEMIRNNQRLKRASYPRRTEDFLINIKNKYLIPKMKDEIRVVSADIAFVDRNENDNSAFSCLRFFPDSDSTDGNHNQNYKIQVPYIETQKGGDLQKQAVRIRQLYNDFQADYIVLDVRNAGISVYDFLAKVLYDDERGIEYSPLKCMNDDVIANRIKNPSAPPVIYCVSASSRINSDMALNMLNLFTTEAIDLLVNREDGMEEVVKYIPDYMKTEEPMVKLFYESPYIETMLFLYECVNLEYERMESTGLIRVKERGGQTKDRYVSVAMGCYFVAELARDMFQYDEKEDFFTAEYCVSYIPF